MTRCGESDAAMTLLPTAHSTITIATTATAEARMACRYSPQMERSRRGLYMPLSHIAYSVIGTANSSSGSLK